MILKMPMPITGMLFLLAVIPAVNGVARASDRYDFRPVVGFLQVPENITLDSCSGVAVNSRGFVYLAHRGQSPIVCFDADGNYVRSWGDDLIGSAHALRIDPDDNLWVTDIQKHLVLKFTSTGTLLLSVGRPGSAGQGNDQFDKPADVTFGSEGVIYVADGYGNSRVMKFSARGKFLMSWGTPGSGPGEFNLPHTIVTTSDGRVIVGDRLNNRVQIFDAFGDHLEVWEGFTPFGLEIDRDDVLWVADGRAHKILRLDRSGAIVQSWGAGACPGTFSRTTHARS